MPTDAMLQLLRDLPAERIWLAYQAPPAADFDDVARALGLRPLGDGWEEVRAHRAEQFATNLLRHGLAYRERRMADDLAAWVARELVRSCGTEGTRYAVNAQGLSTPREGLGSWHDATEHTFDAGVVVLGRTASTCFWVADED